MRAAAPQRVSLVLFGVWVVLTSVQLGWIPFARHAWSFNFWQYLPLWASALLAALSLALCIGRVRAAALAGAERIRQWAPGRGRAAGIVLAWLLVACALWLLREQQLIGDSKIHLVQGHTRLFSFPDVGATFLIGSAVRSARALSYEHDGVIGAVQLVICLSGGLAILFLSRAGRYLARGHAASAALLILSTGLLRIFAGHVEVYAFLLAAVSAYLWSALAFLNGRGSWLAPCLSLGIAVWLHPSALGLVPSLALLLYGQAIPSRERARRTLLGLALTLLPLATFLLVMFAFGPRADVDRAGASFLAIVGASDDPQAAHRWVRLWGGPAGVGTDYVLLAPPHAKYLANAAYLLAPFAVPVVLAFACWRPRSFTSSPTAGFLSAASLPLVAYALLLRPLWGPFDWDLFAVTALPLAALSAHLLAAGLSASTYRQLATGLIGFQLLFVAIPFLVMGIAVAREAGPFASESRAWEVVDPDSPVFDRIAPWL